MIRCRCQCWKISKRPLYRLQLSMKLLRSLAFDAIVMAGNIIPNNKIPNNIIPNNIIPITII